MLPDFNDKGVLPPGVHTAALGEFADRFGFNGDRRSMIKKGLAPFLDELAEEGIRELYVGGSFVTVTRNPGDIDCYVVVTSRGHRWFTFIAESQDRWVKNHAVDCVPAILGESGVESQEYWEDLFSQRKYSGADNGIVRLRF